MNFFKAAAYSFALALSLVSSACRAQTAPAGIRGLVPPQTCDAPAVTLRVTALERGAPGELRMEVEYESSANVPQSINFNRRRTVLVDDTGYQYNVAKSPPATRLLPGGRTRAGYTFLSEVGGQLAHTVDMEIRFDVRSEQSNRACNLTVYRIPIAEVHR